ncbi:HlyD family type I secretion periplasmic adaptor subunit [Propionivibrio dicarboxylicus]|uniref:Membrane fusion protein (MFP) family protein n=1 Tax=Propionivibrio dicarboxylicus TaxID=83767 RepID=A0A1G7YHM9_9RHOO|nr:HlyD family type I secretion periplasmic adaptor subunit [Propionivibrio dicarboxylicus]SDG96061.1 HlyD family secretion protein [Propionivibrio dicarboxylicus]
MNQTASKTLSPAALDFAPGLLSIQESPPARLPRTVMYAVTGLFGVLLAWAVFGQLDIIASAEGKLIPQTYVKIVQPADAGIVREILVKEGQSVLADQVLIRMDMHVAQADQKVIETDLVLRGLQLRRIDAELAEKSLLRKADDPDDLFRQIEAQCREHRRVFEDSTGQAREALRKAQRDYEAGKEVLAKLREVTPIFKAQADAFADMGKEGFAAQVQVRDKQREHLEKARDLRAQEETVASLEAAVAQAARQLSQIASKYRSDLQNERVDAEGLHRKLQQELVKQERKSELLELRASQTGVVKDLATHTIGTVVSPGTVIVSLVPENEPLVAEVMVKNDDVGFVFPRQAVKLKLSAYPFQKYGMLDGEVIHVGPDASEAANLPAKDGNKDKASAQQALSYKALIWLDSQVLEAQGKQLKLVPGMQVVAEINQGRRTVMEYLLSPVRKALHESGRER